MFCKFCGKKVDKPEYPCPHCGKEQGMLRVTDGYFGILDNTLQTDSSRVLTEKEISENKKAVEKEEISEDDARREEIVEKMPDDSNRLDKAIFLNWLKNWKQYANKRILVILVAAIYGFFSLACIIYQNHKIAELNGQLSKLENQRAQYQESAGNENEEKDDSYNE